MVKADFKVHVLLLVLTNVALAAISSQQEEQQSVNSLGTLLNNTYNETPKDAQNKTYERVASNHRPVYVPPVNTSQLQSSAYNISQILQPQVYHVTAPRLNQVVVPKENHLQAPRPHQLEMITYAPQQFQTKQYQAQKLQMPQSLEVPTNLKNMNYYNNNSAEQRLFWPPGHHHPPNCPNHPHFPPIVPPCGGIFTGPTILRHPGFPRTYPASVRCTYKVVPRSQTSPRSCFVVSFIHVAIQWSPNCQQDWLQIDQGARLCGGLSGDKYYQTPGHLIIEFHSGNIPGPAGTGFHIKVTPIPCQIISPPNNHHPPPHICPPKPHLPYHPPIHHPPVHKPPIHYPLPPVRPLPRPPVQENHSPFWWRWYRVLKCEWKGIKDLPPGLCPPPHSQHPPYPQRPPYENPYSRVPSPAKPYNPEPPLPTSPRTPTQGPPETESCSRFIATPQFLLRSDEWLPQRVNQNREWSCQLSIIKASPTACEVFLQLENLNMRCEVEFLEVAGQRVCGNQPFRQLSVDFRGYELRIVYHNLAGRNTPGSFVIRGYQNFDCDPLILDVTPAKKLSSLTATTPLVPSIPRAIS